MAEYNTEIYKQIEDVIDRKKEIGEFDGILQAIRNSRYAYSAPTGSWDDRLNSLDESTNQNYWNSEGDALSNTRDSFISHPSIGPTDSEITVVRVKRESLNNVADNYWDVPDNAILGDGSHLLESPSLVNLVTLIGLNLTKDQIKENLDTNGNEYMVPLSSWEPVTMQPTNFSQRSSANAPSTSQKRITFNLGKLKKSKEQKVKNKIFFNKILIKLRNLFNWRKQAVIIVQESENIPPDTNDNNSINNSDGSQ